jgi:hypothetical protein
MCLACLKGMGLEEWRSYVSVDCQPGRPEGCGPAEIVLVCAGLRGMASRDHEYLWITSLAGFRGAAWWSGDRVGLCRLEYINIYYVYLLIIL